MSKFKVGDRVTLEGVVTAVTSGATTIDCRTPEVREAEKQAREALSSGVTPDDPTLPLSEPLVLIIYL